MNLEILTAENLDRFLAVEKAVLVLSKTDCPACNEWSQELTKALEEEKLPKDIRYGKLIINQKGLLDFKKANPWLADVDILPYNVIYINGKIYKKYGGVGLDRLENRLLSI